LDDYVVDAYHHAKFYTDRIRGFVSAHMRDFAHTFVSAFFSVFWVLPIAYSQDARTDFDAKNIKRRGTSQGCAF